MYWLEGDSVLGENGIELNMPVLEALEHIHNPSVYRYFIVTETNAVEGAWIPMPRLRGPKQQIRLYMCPHP